MIRGRARVPFVVAVLAISVVLAVTVSREFTALTAGSLVVLVQLFWTDGRRASQRPDHATVADWLAARRERRRDR